MSSASNKYITNEEAVPIIRSDIFSGHEDSRFAIGVLDKGEILSYAPGTIAQAYLKLRANVYVDQTGMLDHSVKRPDGTELDEDDERSIHFVSLENRMGGVAVFSCMRFILKDTIDGKPLPIEQFFSEVFIEPAPVNSIEVSRFIVRHDNIKQSMLAKKKMITTGLAYVADNNLGPIFGVVEPGFERDINFMKLPNHRIASPKLVHEYNDYNLGIEIDRVGAINRMGEVTIRDMALNSGMFKYWGRVSSEANKDLE